MVSSKLCYFTTVASGTDDTDSAGIALVKTQHQSVLVLFHKDPYNYYKLYLICQ